MMLLSGSEVDDVIIILEKFSVQKSCGIPPVILRSFPARHEAVKSPQDDADFLALA
jgi:hypothetical protein